MIEQLPIEKGLSFPLEVIIFYSYGSREVEVRGWCTNGQDALPLFQKLWAALASLDRLRTTSSVVQLSTTLYVHLCGPMERWTLYKAT